MRRHRFLERIVRPEAGRRPAAIASVLGVLIGFLPLQAGHAEEPPLLEVVSRQVIPAAHFRPFVPPGAKTVPLTIVLQEGSPWDRAGALEADLGKASGILAQCGTTLGEARVLRVRWSREALEMLNEEKPSKGPAAAAVMREPLLPTARPLVFLFPRGLVPTQSSAYIQRWQSRYGRLFPGTGALVGTIWMTADWVFRPRPRTETAGYSTWAHELAHILGNFSHTPDSPNLMSEVEEPGSMSADLNDKQCEAIRAFEAVP